LKKSIRRLGTIGLLCLVLSGGIIFSMVTYVQKINAKKQEALDLENELYSLREEEELLNSEYTKLSDPLYIGKYAREKYLYSKDGEIIIKLPITP